MWTIRPYAPTDEEAWLRCRVLAFLHSAYYDDVHIHKDAYEHRALELVAAEPSLGVIGLLDAELDDAPGTAASPGETRGAVLWNVAVHPDWQRQRVGRDLLRAALPQLQAAGIQRVEAWTRDDPPVVAWYERQGFRAVETYHHVYLEGSEHRGWVQSSHPGLHPVKTFAHFAEATLPAGLQGVARHHVCQRFERMLRTPWP
jgi:ribosomal protein S18 acetylase RimI-like enzyme